MTTKKFGQVTAFLVAIFMIVGIGSVVLMKKCSWMSLFVGSTASLRVKDFFQPKYNLSFQYPESFVKQSEADGDVIYADYFATRDIKDDFDALKKSDAVLNVAVDKAGRGPSKNNLKELEQLGVVKVEYEKVVSVAGVSGTQYLVSIFREKPGCDVRTHFVKDGKAYKIGLFSPGSCDDTVKKFMDEYSLALRSFRVSE